METIIHIRPDDAKEAVISGLIFGVSAHIIRTCNLPSDLVLPLMGGAVSNVGYCLHQMDKRQRERVQEAEERARQAKKRRLNPKLG
ncbi:hypothetical protein KKE45_02885 [Patescibacteria group bacterium]|nr:hypothetical protein [Patescibacteria group bacterium]